MYLQTGYQWRVAAEVNGAGSNGFQDTDVSYNSFISTTTGISFAPQAAPASLTWNTNYSQRLDRCFQEHHQLRGWRRQLGHHAAGLRRRNKRRRYLHLRLAERHLAAGDIW